MSELRDILKEEYIKKEEDSFTPQLLMEMIETALDAMPAVWVAQIEEGKTSQPAGTGRRTLRLPAVHPTEISVGQKPDSADRALFELWMGNLGITGTGSAVNQKLTAITEVFEDPAAFLEEATIPKVLSYLMFLNQFVWMLKEFNASVAGFLWEPFLAALFGGRSEQVPTSRGDIADIRIYTPGRGGVRNAPISLKILNKAGTVKGSFSDLVKHFAGGGDNMRYVIVVKTQSEKEKAVSGVTFYEFNITAENFFEWIGPVEYEEVPQLAEKSFTITRALDKKEPGVVMRWGPSTLKKGGSWEGIYLYIRHSKSARKKQTLDWVRIGKRLQDGQIEIYGDKAKSINLQGVPPDGIVDPDATELSAEVAYYVGGGVGGATVQRKYQPRAAAAGADHPGFAGKDTKLLWGGNEGLGFWKQIAGLVKMGRPNLDPPVLPVDPQVFFQAVKGDFSAAVPVELQPLLGPDPIPGALGARKSKKKGGAAAEEGEAPPKGGTQFHITPAHYMGLGDEIGSIKITTHAVDQFFINAAAKMNDSLIDMFNNLADLTDNIGRFFLVECGEGKKCTDEDKGRIDDAGKAATKNADDLEKNVEKAVATGGMAGKTTGPQWTGQHE